MDKHLLECFKQNLGRRGVTFYNEEKCNFLTWVEVFRFLEDISEKKGVDEVFSERLEDALANYDPDVEFLAVRQNDDTISVELYSHP